MHLIILQWSPIQFALTFSKFISRNAGPTTCKLTQLGTEYVGTLNVTEGGIPCQAWTAQSPHVPKSLTNSDFPDGSLAAADNYCRNPDGSAGPWCYTMVPASDGSTATCPSVVSLRLLWLTRRCVM